MKRHALAISVSIFILAPTNVLAHTKTIIGTNSNDIDPSFCVLQGHKDRDLIFGLDGIDELCGRADKDRLYGGNDNDTLIGGRGDDKLYGSYGNDQLWGTRGNDQLSDLFGINAFNCGKGIDSVRTNLLSIGNVASNCEKVEYGLKTSSEKSISRVE